MKKLYGILFFIFTAFVISCTNGDKIDKLLDDYEKLIDDTIKLNTKMSDPHFNLNAKEVADIYQLMQRKKRVYDQMDAIDLSEYSPEQRQRLESLYVKINEFYKTRKYGIFNL